MRLTRERKNLIKAMTYVELVTHLKLSEADNPWFQGETGEYWGRRMKQLRELRKDRVNDNKTTPD